MARRQKAVEYPDDRRNLDSAEEYERLAKTVKDVPDDLLVAYSEAFEDLPDSERWQEMLKDIFRGFADFDNATELGNLRGRVARPSDVIPQFAELHGSHLG